MHIDRNIFVRSKESNLTVTINKALNSQTEIREEDKDKDRVEDIPHLGGSTVSSFRRRGGEQIDTFAM